MIYFVRVGGDDGPIKIGKSINVLKRMDNLSSQYRQDITLLAVAPGGYKAEAKMHAKFAHRALPLGGFEMFKQCEELDACIQRYRVDPVTKRYRTRQEAVASRPKRDTSMKRIAKADRYLNKGWSVASVAERLKVSTGSIYNYWQRDPKSGRWRPVK